MGSFSIAPVGREFLVHVIGSKVQLLRLTMFGAGLGPEDLLVPFEDGAGKDAVALGTDTLGSPYETSNLLWLRL